LDGDPLRLVARQQLATPITSPSHPRNRHTPARGRVAESPDRVSCPGHALGLVHYLRTVGYEAWIEDMNGNEIANPS
jgi:hypothetical protein